MATRSEAFLDTSYAIALVVRQDEYHERANDIAARLIAERRRIVTTAAVVFELGNALARDPFRPLAVGLIDRLLNDPASVILSVDDRLLSVGYAEFVKFTDKSWTLVDCISFTVMR